MESLQDLSTITFCLIFYTYWLQTYDLASKVLIKIDIITKYIYIIVNKIQSYLILLNMIF